MIADKSEDLALGQILMLCVDGRAKATLDVFEEEKDSPWKYSKLKQQFTAGFYSEANRGSHMTAFERCINRLTKAKKSL